MNIKQDISSTSSSSVICPKCQNVLRYPVICEKCNQLFDVGKIDYFALFGLDKKFSVNIDELEQRYLELTKLIHPDLHTNSSGEALTLSMKISIEINNAYKVLKDPITRAEYLLSLTNAPEISSDQVPEGLLSYILHLREQFEFAQAESDRDKVEDIREAVRELKKRTESKIYNLANNLTPSPDVSVTNELRRELNAIKYINNLAKQIGV